MCRFVAYIGQKPVLIEEFLGRHENSLIKQSREAVEGGRTGLNGDGFGIGWYDRQVKSEPALFKSVQPAWNDQNLAFMASMVKSSCLLGHVRASTIGEVGLHNCHPFHFGEFLFVHNGTIDGFDKIKRKLIGLLSDKVYHNIKGQTDSEHFFALIMERLSDRPSGPEQMADAVREALDAVNEMQEEALGHCSYKINIALTNGKSLLVLKKCTPNIEKPLSLYLHGETSTEKGHLISSERLWEDDAWQEIPPDHFFLVNESLKGTFAPC